MYQHSKCFHGLIHHPNNIEWGVIIITPISLMRNLSTKRFNSLMKAMHSARGGAKFGPQILVPQKLCPHPLCQT